MSTSVMSIPECLRDILIEKKVFVKPVIRNNGRVSQDHDTAFLSTGAKIRISVPANHTTNSMIDPLKHLTIEQKKEFASMLGLEVDELNPRAKKNLWINRFVVLDKSDRQLDLSDIDDYIDYSILVINKSIVAPSWNERLNLGTYKYVLVEEEEESKTKVSDIKDKKEAYKLLGKLETKKQDMIDFLSVYYLTKKEYKTVPSDAKENFLIAECGKIVEDDTVKFLDILKDPNYDTKLLLQKSIALGSITRHNYKYGLPGEDYIGGINEMIEFLNNPKNQTIKFKLQSIVEEANKGK